MQVRVLKDDVEYFLDTPNIGNKGNHNIVLIYGQMKNTPNRERNCYYEQFTQDA